MAYDVMVMQKQLKTNSHRAAAAALSVALAASVPFQAASAKINSSLVEHKAFYEMQMGERLQNSHIVNINGMSAFAIERDCTGWRSIEDYMIQFVAESGGSDRVLS
ncbi:MAG: cell envelope integrity EipB family protein, partial [Alphaproteobacteria bacterium]|nr:cell envelope integrity EipB family protein [Alphaproteobacteria bacterium]